jgi:hypothetical protein
MQPSMPGTAAHPPIQYRDPEGRTWQASQVAQLRVPGPRVVRRLSAADRAAAEGTRRLIGGLLRLGADAQAERLHVCVLGVGASGSRRIAQLQRRRLLQVHVPRRVRAQCFATLRRAIHAARASAIFVDDRRRVHGWVQRLTALRCLLRAESHVNRFKSPSSTASGGTVPVRFAEREVNWSGIAEIITLGTARPAFASTLWAHRKWRGVR